MILWLEYRLETGHHIEIEFIEGLDMHRFPWLFAASVVFLLWQHPHVGRAGVLTLAPTDEGSVVQGVNTADSRALGLQAQLTIQDIQNSYHQLVRLEFDLSAIPLNATVTSAAFNYFGDPTLMALYQPSFRWESYTGDGSIFPPGYVYGNALPNDVTLVTLTIPQTTGATSLDVTSVLADSLNRGDDYFGLQGRLLGSQYPFSSLQVFGLFTLSQSDDPNPANRPALVITYVPEASSLLTTAMSMMLLFGWPMKRLWRTRFAE